MESTEGAKRIVKELAENGYTADEALKTLKEADSMIRIARANLYKRVGESSLIEVLREDDGYSPSSGKSPDE